MKEELDNLRRDNNKHESVCPATRSYDCCPRKWKESRVETSDPLLFDVSTFYYDQEEEEGRRDKCTGLGGWL